MESVFTWKFCLLRKFCWDNIEESNLLIRHDNSDMQQTYFRLVDALCEISDSDVLRCKLGLKIAVGEQTE